jgi:hypothetical protein
VSTLSIKLKQRTTVLLVAGVLLMVLVALLIQPDVANAQGAQKEERPVVVVNPDDTLWSISQQRLHQNATPQEVMNEMERIYQLNRSQLGNNPDLLLAGQQLLLTPLAAEPTAAAAPPTSAEPATAAEPTAAEPTAAADRASAGPVEEQQTITLPDMPEVELVAVNSSIGAEASLLESYAGIQRRTLGVGIIALTIILAVLMAWRLPMNRPVGGYGLWGIPSGYGYSENYALLSRDAESTPGGASPTNNDESHSDTEEKNNQKLPPHESEEDEPPVGTNLRVVGSSESDSERVVGDTSEEHRDAG